MVTSQSVCRTTVFDSGYRGLNPLSIAKWCIVLQRSWSGLTMPLSKHNEGIYQEASSHATRQGHTRPQSSQLAEPLWNDPGLKSGISVRKLIPT